MQPATWQLKEGLKETKKRSIQLSVEKMRKKKIKIERKRKGCVERKWKVQKNLKL